jgi:hypothetical protein
MVVGTPAIDYVGRFDVGDALGPTASWPGVRAVAQFDGTAASVTLSQTDGYSGGPSWFDVTVDGKAADPFFVKGASETHAVATGLAAGTHVVEVVKRTEANLGAVRFEGFTFPGGGKLLAPPARAAHRIEFLSDSTIDGFGVLGNAATTCAGGAPPQFDDAQLGTAAIAANALTAEMVLLAYSGKGLTLNQDGTKTDLYGDIYGRTLPDGTAPWTFASAVPDAVVISLGGTDYDASLSPAGFQSKYDALVGAVRGHYPNAHVFCTVWSQIKTWNGVRQAMGAVLQAVVNARAGAGDAKVYYYEFPEANYDTDETGCYNHGNVAHHQAMGTLLAAQIKAKTGW